MVNQPRILTTAVESYPVPEWLVALPSVAALIDATRVVFATQREAGIDLPTDGELYRFDVNHPDTNGMIEYFVRRLGGMRREIGREDIAGRTLPEAGEPDAGSGRRPGPPNVRTRVRLRASR